MRRQGQAPPERGDVPPELFQPRKQLRLVRLLESHVFYLSILCRSCIIGIVVLLVLKTGHGNPIYVNVSSTLMINRATSLTIAVKFLTSLSRRRLSRSKASAFSVLACKENIRNVNSNQEHLEIWFKSD